MGIFPPAFTVTSARCGLQHFPLCILFHIVITGSVKKSTTMISTYITSCFQIVRINKMAALVALLAHLFRSTLRYVFPRSRYGFLVERTPYGLPVPVCVHCILPESDIEGKSLVIVGDVHGCYDELEELVDKCRCKDTNVCTVFVGDLINKGPKSVEVVKLVRSMDAHCVRGNHDEVCLRSWQNYVEGREPLSSEFQWMRQLDRGDLEWLFELPYTLTIPSLNICVVHAGLVPCLPLQQQPLDSMLHMRNVSYDVHASRWAWHKKIGREGTLPWASEWTGPEHVYFGHDAIRKLQQYLLATGLDTGCVYGGKLTAIFPLEEGKLVQVDAHTIHKEPGRRMKPKLDS